MTTPTIVGAGLAGLIAAHAWPTSPIIESSEKPRAVHRALLRFRSDAVGRLTGIEFRRVRVRKGIWAEGASQQPSIRWANLYAQKVLSGGQLKGDRSIWNLDAADRFIAPDDFYEQLIDSVGGRILWGAPADFRERKNPLVSTAPLPVVLAAVGIEQPFEFPRSPIKVHRWKIPGADVFQTIYFPESHLNIYRASITGDTLIVETVGGLGDMDEEAINDAFGIRVSNCESLGSVEQKYGKISPVDDSVRKQLLFKLTHYHNIYSLGRFATWRNILLDDVVDDITAIKKLLKVGNAYDVRKAAA
jgi:hypothetical protein